MKPNHTILICAILSLLIPECFAQISAEDIQRKQTINYKNCGFGCERSLTLTNDDYEKLRDDSKYVKNESSDEYIDQLESILEKSIYKDIFEKETVVLFINIERFRKIILIDKIKKRKKTVLADINHLFLKSRDTVWMMYISDSNYLIQNRIGIDLNNIRETTETKSFDAPLFFDAGTGERVLSIGVMSYVVPRKERDISIEFTQRNVETYFEETWNKTFSSYNMAYNVDFGVSVPISESVNAQKAFLTMAVPIPFFNKWNKFYREGTKKKINIYEVLSRSRFFFGIGLLTNFEEPGANSYIMGYSFTVIRNVWSVNIGATDRIAKLDDETRPIRDSAKFMIGGTLSFGVFERLISKK